MQLYKIEQHIRDLLEDMDSYIDEETGELNPDFLGKLDALDIEVKYKIEAIGVVVRELKGDAETLKSELDRLKARKASMEKRAGWLVDYVSSTMRALKIEKHTSPGGLFTVYLQKSPDALQVDRPSALPTAFQRVSVEANKTDLKKALEAGELTDEIIGLAGIALMPGAKKVRYK